MTSMAFMEYTAEAFQNLFSSPGRTPGRAVVLPPASASASALALASAAASALAKRLTFK